MDGWRKSTYSDANGGQCVEAADGHGLIMVRDTANRSAGALTFTAQAWREFTSTIS